MSEDFNHQDCEYYIKQNDGCLLYFELGASNVSQYGHCYKKILGWDDEE